jgi:putative nucleotidyltransferase with HDIG domain
MKRALFFLRYRYTYIYRGVLFLLAMFVMVYFFPKTARFSYQYTQGYPWAHQSLKAPFDFAVLKPEKDLKKEKQESLASIIPYYRYHENMGDSLLPLVNDGFDKEWGSVYGKGVKLSKRNQTKALVDRVFNDLLKTGIRSQEINRNSPDGRINLLKGNEASQIPLSALHTLASAEKYITEEVKKATGVDKKIALHVLTSHLFRNVTYDQLTTAKEEKAKLANISTTFGMVQKGELIISEGELVTAEKYQMLESLRQEFEKQLGGNREFYGILIGQVILMIFVFLALMMYLNLFRPIFLRDTHMLLLLLVAIMMMVIPESIIIQYFPDYVYFFPLPILAIIIRSFFDERTAMFVYLLTTIIIASFIPDGYNFMFLQLITGIITIVSIYKLNKRAQFYITSFWIFLSYSLIYLALLLVSDGSLDNINYKIFYNFAISAGLTLFSYPIIYFFEKLFSQVTHLSLLELSDTNNKLLRDLAQKAPGTFQHSLQVGNLAEAALSEIGGNTLLVRAGALYHDIGKMYNPVYFIENQTTHINPHDELSYEESADTIIQHVIQGVSLAKKHNIPEMIVDFIRTHHGNRKVEYFYRLALQESGEDEVDASIYTYPGPIPYNRETAVMMMADSIEAAARSIPKPDEIKLGNLVDQIIEGQMQTGQFENADITLKEISTIKKIFKKMLLTIYHIRIEYPT